MYYTVIKLYRDSTCNEQVYPTQQIKVNDNEILPEEVVRKVQRKYEQTFGYNPYAEWKTVNTKNPVDAMLS